MILNSIKLSIRDIKRNTTFVLLNIIGFSVGLAVFMVIALFVYNELTVDTHYPAHKRMYRVLENNNNAGIDYNLSAVLSSEFPEVEKACPVYQSTEFDFSLETKTNWFESKTFISTNNDFFEMFGIDALKTLDQSIMPTNNSIVLTASTANILFGKEDALGKQVKFGDRMLTVSAIIPDFSKNSSLSADFIINSKNESDRFYRSEVKGKTVILNDLYVILAQNTDPKILAQKVNQNMAAHLSTVSTINFQPIQSIYLRPDIKLSRNRLSSKTTIFVFIAIALVLLLLSIINYIQFSISYHFSNLKNIGLQIFNGASKKNIYQYYLINTSVMLAIALVLAFILLWVFTPYVNPLFSGAIILSNVSQWPFILAVLLVLILIIGLGGFLPLYVISKTGITSLLNNRVVQTYKPPIKGFLPVIQFSCAIVLLISTLTIQKQLSFVKETNLGFVKQNLLQLRIPNDYERTAILSEKMAELPFVESVTWSSGAPALIGAYFSSSPDSVNGEEKDWIVGIGVDNSFLKTFKIELLGGHEFVNSDLNNSCYVNETFLKSKNWTKPEHYLNQTFVGMKIVGVVNDFFNNSLHHAIKPMVLYNTNHGLYILNIRLSKGNVKEQLSQINSVWNELIPGHFFDYKFYDDVFDNMYKSEEKLGKAINLFSLIAFFLTAMGLLGLIIQQTISRTKEIGIRKVNGATIFEVMLMLNKDFVKWVAIAFVIACPIAWYAMNKWLENFAYKTELSWWIFALAGLLALGIALLTVSWQSWKAATRNPVESLKYE